MRLIMGVRLGSGSDSAVGVQLGSGSVTREWKCDSGVEVRLRSGSVTREWEGNSERELKCISEVGVRPGLECDLEECDSGVGVQLGVGV